LALISCCHGTDPQAVPLEAEMLIPAVTKLDLADFLLDFSSVFHQKDLLPQTNGIISYWELVIVK